MIRDIRWSAVGHTFSVVASLITVPLLTRALIPAQYGLYKTIFVFTSLVLFFGNFEITSLVRKSVPQADHRRTNLLTAALLMMNVPVIIGIFALWITIFAGYTASFSVEFHEFARKNILLLSGLVWATLSYNTVTAVLSGLKRFQGRALIQLIVELLFLVLVITLLALQKITLGYIIVGYLSTRLSGIIIAGYLIRDTFANPDISKFWEEFKSVSIPLLPRTAAKNFGGVVPNAIIVSTFGEAVFATWAVALTFKQLFLIIGKPISDVLLPELSSRIAQNRGLEGIFSKYYRLILLVNAPLVVGGILIGDDIIKVVFGAAYEPAQWVVPLLLTSFGIQTVNTIAAQFFIASDAGSYETISRFIEYGVRILIVLIGAIVFHSLAIIAAGFLVSNGLRYLFALWYQYRMDVLSKPNINDSIAFCGCLALMGGFVVLNLNHADSFFGIIIIIVGSVLIYSFSLFVTGIITEIEKGLVEDIFGFS